MPRQLLVAPTRRAALCRGFRGAVVRQRRVNVFAKVLVKGEQKGQQQDRVGGEQACGTRRCRAAQGTGVGAGDRGGCSGASWGLRGAGAAGSGGCCTLRAPGALEQQLREETESCWVSCLADKSFACTSSPSSSSSDCDMNI